MRGPHAGRLSFLLSGRRLPFSALADGPVPRPTGPRGGRRRPGEDRAQSPGGVRGALPSGAGGRGGDGLTAEWPKLGSLGGARGGPWGCGWDLSGALSLNRGLDRKLELGTRPGARSSARYRTLGPGMRPVGDSLTLWAGPGGEGGLALGRGLGLWVGQRGEILVWK